MESDRTGLVNPRNTVEKTEAQAEAGADSAKKCGTGKNRMRRSRTRKPPLSCCCSSCFINMAEARREIVNALHLHRSLSTTSADSRNPKPVSSTNYYHRLVNSMPIPEPTWSTTAPAVLCAPIEGVEFDLVDNQSSSYSWWAGFLNSLNGGGAGGNAESLGEGSHGEMDEKSDSNVIDESLFTDEWLVFPGSEDH